MTNDDVARPMLEKGEGGGAAGRYGSRWPAPTEKAVVVPFETRHAEAFRDLNLAWIERYFGKAEDKDYELLDAPWDGIVRKGGAVLIAECREGQAVGTVALVPLGDGVLELAKMAVTSDTRVKGSDAFWWRPPWRLRAGRERGRCISNRTRASFLRYGSMRARDSSTCLLTNGPRRDTSAATSTCAWSSKLDLGRP